jgi:hypothetical protein
VATAEVDVRRVAKYPPECFISALPTDLVAGSNKVAEYVGFEGIYILSLQGLSFSRCDGLRFRISADGFTDVVRMDDLGAARGLDYEEAAKLPAARSAALYIDAPSAVSSYQWRHRVAVFRPTAALKLQLGLSLSEEDRRLAEKYGLENLLRLQVPVPYDLARGIEEWRTQAVRMTGSGTVLRVVVPKGKKVVLAGISAARPAAAASGYIHVTRDDVADTLKLDPYCLPSLSYDAPIRVVALDKLLVEWDQAVSGTYCFRVVYGLGRISIPEKIAWNLDLTREEREKAEREDLFDRVRAGVV